MRHATLVRLCAAALCGLASACNQTPSTVKAMDGGHAFVRLPGRHLTPELVRETGFNRDHKRDDQYAFGYLRREALETLPADVFKDVIELDARSWARHDFDPRSLELRPEAETDPGVDFEDYHHYEALTAELQQLQTAHPGIVKLESAGRSVQGRELWVLKLSDNAAAEEDEPKLLYIANMHGDEVVDRELMIYLSRLLTSEYGRNPRITALLDNSQIYIMPSMNPDGFESGGRHNAGGVDLNRDFPDFTSDPRDVPTNRAPETKAVMALHQRHHFVLAINFHGGEVCVNVPWDTKANARAADKFGDDPLMQRLAHEYADANPTMKANSGGSFDRGVTYGYEWYEVDGGMQDWAIHYRHSIHATIELSHTKWPSASNLPRMWEENREALVRYLEQGTFGAHLQVVDPQGVPVPGATVRVSTLARDVPYTTSHINRPALPGAQTVRVSAPGFQTKDVAVTPATFVGEYQEIVLSR